MSNRADHGQQASQPIATSTIVATTSLMVGVLGDVDGDLGL
ncbi:hypothetical protein [Nocardia sp. NBC_01009]|nr:hypothetical protein OHA42_17290 [Nocardia sp. NBC_01009]